MAIETENKINDKPNLTNYLNFNAQTNLNSINSENDENKKNNKKSGFAKIVASKLMCCFCATTNLATPLRRQNQYTVKNEEVTNHTNNLFNKNLIKTTKKQTKNSTVIHNKNNNKTNEPIKYSW